MSNNEKNAWIVVRLILLLIAFLFVLYGLFLKQPCDLDAVFLSCRLTGTWGDFLGGALFLTGLVTMSGIVKGFDNLSNPPNTSLGNLLVFAATALGIVLFWNW